MKQSNRLSNFLLVFAFVSVVGCAGSGREEGTGDSVTDSWITKKVKAALVDDPAVRAIDVNVETVKGRVQLTGFVSSDTAMHQAVWVARGIKGVTEVKNDIRVK